MRKKLRAPFDLVQEPGVAQIKHGDGLGCVKALLVYERLQAPEVHGDVLDRIPREQQCAHDDELESRRANNGNKLVCESALWHGAIEGCLASSHPDLHPAVRPLPLVSATGLLPAAAALPSPNPHRLPEKESIDCTHATVHLELRAHRCHSPWVVADVVERDACPVFHGRW